MTPEVLALNAQFSARVMVSYRLDAMNANSHSFYTVDANGHRTCLDMGGESSSVVLIPYECHADDKELYVFPPLVPLLASLLSSSSSSSSLSL